jgi:hypothetical protein
MKSIVVALVLVAAWSGSARAGDRIVRPAVPQDIEVDAQFRPFLVGHAVGTQNYICATAPTASGRDWVFIGPQATLFDARGQQIITHFHSYNPIANAIQATWQHSRDSSAVWAVRFSGSPDPAGAIEWLKLSASGDTVGPTLGDVLTGTLFIQRVNTVGGVKPPEAQCTASLINTRRLVPYEADYYFYR